MDNTTLRVDLDKKEALLIIDLFSMDIADSTERLKIVSLLTEIPSPLLVSIQGSKVDVKMDYDFGNLVPEKIWEMRNNSFVQGFSDNRLSLHWEHLCKEAVLECVKQMLPVVLKSSKKMVESLIERWNKTEG